jgi:hypothetical protein
MKKYVLFVLLALLATPVSASFHEIIPGPRSTYVPLQPAHEGAWVSPSRKAPIISIASLPGRDAVVASLSPSGRPLHTTIVPWRDVSSFVGGPDGQLWEFTTNGPNLGCEVLTLKVYADEGFSNGFEEFPVLPGFPPVTVLHEFEYQRADPYPLGVTKHCTVCPPSFFANDCIDELF